jgi:hypothetical protein
MYFVTLSLITAVESTFDFILSWIPFYAWIRFFVHLYLILPGSQGASFLYCEYIEPFLYHHEREIDDFITDAHDRARSAGLNYFQQGIEWIKVHVLGFAPQKPAAAAAPGQTYAQSFMSRFAMPGARGGGGGTDNLSNLVSQALSGASALYAGTAAAGEAGASSSSRGGAGLVPDSIRNTDDRLNYVASQRERLTNLLQAFDREQDNLRVQRESGSRYHDSGSAGLRKNRSEDQFDRIERDEIGTAPPPYPVTPPAFDRRTSSGWMPWNWRAGQGASPSPQPQPRRASPDEGLAYGRDNSRARSSGYDLGDR